MITPGRISLLSVESNKVRVWNGSSWVMKYVVIYNGSQYVNVDSLKVWDGSKWISSNL